MDDDIVQVQAVKRGDRAAFDFLVRKYMKPAYAYCKRMLNNHEDAEDVSQNAFLKAYNNIGCFEEKSSFKTWFYTILANECMNRIKSGKTRHTVSMAGAEDKLTAPGTVSSGSYESDADYTRGKINDAVNILPERQRIAFTLNCYQGLDYNEIAVVLSCSYENVKMLVSLARKSLREQLKGIMKL